jgi:DNA polymerase III subunit delta
MSSLYTVKGSDESLVSSAVHALVNQLVGTGDRGLMLEDFDGEEYEIRSVVDAAQTSPFLTDRRVVVARGIGRFATDDVQPLVAYLANPLPTTDLVLTLSGGRLAKAFTDAVSKAGANVIETDVSSNKKERGFWFDEQIAAAGLKLDGEARNRFAEHVGEDVSSVNGILETLVATYGTKTMLHKSDIAPFLGDAGSVAPWDLTDSIDRGDTALALKMLHRMMGSGERHSLQILSLLHTHYQRMLKLDGASYGGEQGAADLLGLKSTFQARKAMDQIRRLGHDGVVRAFALLAQSDLDVRGAKDWPEDLVMEVLVARLSRLGGAPARAGAGARR